MRKTDANTIGKSNACALRAAHRARIHPSARGFVMGRQLQHNAMELDGRARVASSHWWGWRCVLVFLEYMAAFPMLSQYLWLLILGILGLPLGFLNRITSVDCLNAARSTFTNDIIFWYCAGILQWDPLSGLLSTLDVGCFCRHACHKVGTCKSWHGAQLRQGSGRRFV